MKRLITLTFCLLPLTAMGAGEGGFAPATDFGYPAPQLTETSSTTHATERVWHPAGEKPLRATVKGIRGLWGNNAIVILRTPTGRMKEYAASTLAEKDLQAVRNWMQENNYEPFETYQAGKTMVRIRNVVPLRNEYHVSLVMENGLSCTLKTNKHPVHRDKALQMANVTTCVTDETLALLQRHAEKKPGGTPSLPIVTSADDALLYAATHGCDIVVMYLNRRGSAIDEAFRHYLAKHPELVSRWGAGFVFLMAYADEHGNYPPHCHRDIMRLHYLHRSEGDHNPPPINTTAATIHMELARQENTQHVSYSVFSHRFVSGSPHIHGFRSNTDSGTVFYQRLYKGGTDEFKFWGR